MKCKMAQALSGLEEMVLKLAFRWNCSNGKWDKAVTAESINLINIISLTQTYVLEVNCRIHMSDVRQWFGRFESF